MKKIMLIFNFQGKTKPEFVACKQDTTDLNTMYFTSSVYVRGTFVCVAITL